MKRGLFIMLLALFTCVASYGQTTKRERNLIKQGNEYFSKKQYDKAEECYSRVLEINPNSQIARYNLASTMLRQRRGSENSAARDSVIMQNLNSVGDSQSAPAGLRAHSFYNLGRMAYDKQDYAASVDYFKRSLKINPKDEQARKNLRMAQKKLQQKQDKDKDKDKDKNKDDKKKQQDKQQPPQNQPQPPKQPQQQTNKDQLLKAMQNEEKNTRDKVNRRKAQMSHGRSSNRPW